MQSLTLTLAGAALLATALLTACDGPTGPTDSLTENTATPAFAVGSKAVDPAALTPAPAQVGATAECQADGRWIVCHTLLALTNVNVPNAEFNLPCGTLYENSTDVRHGIRWYNAADSVIVKRHVTQDLEGTLSLSPTGAAPTVIVTAHDNWYDSQYADPNDLDSGLRASHGDGIEIRAPGVGVIAHIAGLDTPEGTHRGVLRFIDEAAGAAKLCAALTR